MRSRWPENLENDSIAGSQELQGITGLYGFGQDDPTLLIRDEFHGGTIPPNNREVKAGSAKKL
jgi:hypothetical protein